MKTVRNELKVGINCLRCNGSTISNYFIHARSIVLVYIVDNTIMVRRLEWNSY